MSLFFDDDACPADSVRHEAAAQAQNISRPASSVSDRRYDQQSQQHQQTQQQQQNQGQAGQQASQKNSSVVIKVGMVGDAQIGKTSLMVKYVEGSWDEDYIQTLGMLSVPLLHIWKTQRPTPFQASTLWKRQSASGILKSLFQYGTSVVSASLSTCCL